MSIEIILGAAGWGLAMIDEKRKEAHPTPHSQKVQNALNKIATIHQHTENRRRNPVKHR